MRFSRRWVVVVAMTVTAAVPAACGGDDSAAQARALRRETAGEKLKIEKPKEKGGGAAAGAPAGNVVELKLSGAGLEIVEPDGDTSGRTGHYVVFVNKDPVPFGARIPEERDVIETEESSVTVTGLTAGAHKVTLVLADGAHRRIGTTSADTSLTVTAPTLRASALRKSPPKQPVVVSVAVQGVGVAPPDGSAATGTGHFAVFVDRDPTAAGAPVPAERGIIRTADQTISVPDLGGGEHEIWVVLVKGDETPFDPMVADKIDVEVG